MRRLCLFVIAGWGLVQGADAQGSPPPDRVFHLWVDPVYGRDTPAPVQNPQPSASICPGGSPPNLPPDVRDGSGLPLLHAPWPFKTLTRAIQYLCTNSPNGQANPPLPYISNFGGNTFTVRAAVIHLLPGIYARLNVDDPHSGIAGNGETFPILLPQFVSVRGTSALNTVFIGGNTYSQCSNNPTLSCSNGTGPFFAFGETSAYGGAITGEGCFIDKIALINAMNFNPENQNYWGNWGRAAVAIVGGPHFCKPTFTNCLFLQNGIGVAVSALNDTSRHDGVTLVNNTFVANYIGVWNGMANGRQSITNQTNRGYSRLVLVNNILDSAVFYGAGPPNPGAADCPWAPLPSNDQKPPSWGPYGMNGGHGWAGLPSGLPSDFEGVDAADLAVVNMAGNQDVNAYNLAGSFGNYNRVNPAFIPGFPVTLPRATGPAGPGINIAPYTGWAGTAAGNGQRGILYVRDLFCAGQLAVPAQLAPSPNPAEWDASPMDFRLSPRAALASAQSAATPNAPSVDNPLIDSGFFATITPTTPLVMSSGLQLAHPPGYIQLNSAEAQATWPYSSWDEDCEGYGNARVHDHPKIANTGAGSPIDMGFDECGDLIVTGYRAMTTRFMGGDQVRPQFGFRNFDNIYVTYIGYPGTISSADAELPRFRAYEYITAPPGHNPAYDASTSPPIYRTWTALRPLNPTSTYYIPSIVDVVPHLLPDIHPWWHFSSLPVPSNPIWQHCNVLYNPSLYWNPTTDIINPPGTKPEATVTPFGWLDEFPPPLTHQYPVFGPLGAGPADIAGFTNWCVGHPLAVGVPYFDTLPRTDLTNNLSATVMVRYSVEKATASFYGTAQRNIQTFDILIGWRR